MATEIPKLQRVGGTDNPVYPGQRDSQYIRMDSSRGTPSIDAQIEEIRKKISLAELNAPPAVTFADGSANANDPKYQAYQRYLNNINELETQLSDLIKTKKAEEIQFGEENKQRQERWDAMREEISKRYGGPMFGKVYDSSTGKEVVNGIIDESGNVNTNKLVTVNGKTYKRDSYGNYTEFRG